MSEENCEKSEREFEDYFRKERPADLIPRLENVLERVDGYDEQELDVAGDILEYVIMQLESMDEDTAGEVSEKSGELEPVAHVHQYGDLCMHKSAYERLQDKLDEGPHGFTDVYDDCDDRVETWVRLSDVQERVEELWRTEENLHRAFIKLRSELKDEEFTQNGGTDD